jgi:hypothetical protein
VVASVRHVLIMLLALGTLWGCQPARSPKATALIAPHLRFAIPSPRELGYPVDAVQLVTARYHDDVQLFEARLAVSAERLTFIGIDPFGRRALTVSLSDGGMTVDAAPWLPLGLRAENVLADVALVYWPEDAVRRGLSGSSAVLRDSEHERSVIAEGREIIHVDYEEARDKAWAGSVRFRNSAFDYELDLRSAVVAP